MSERSATGLITADEFLRMPENRGAETHGRTQVLTQDQRLDVRADGSLDGREILPGFTLSLAELFKGPEG